MGCAGSLAAEPARVAAPAARAPQAQAQAQAQPSRVSTSSATAQQVAGVANKGVEKGASMLSSVYARASEQVEKKTGKNPNEWMNKAKESVVSSTSDWKQKMTQQMDTALASMDNSRVNSLLDSALAARLLGDKNVPSAVRRAANQVASRQLQEAIDAEDPKRLKGALVAARRLNATGVPEFQAAIAAYQRVKKLPQGWDVSKMVLHREGDKMVAKMPVNDPNVRAKFQQLLDLTHRKVYTRDRQGLPVPERLELVGVSAVTNDDLWADYMARRETVRQELLAEPLSVDELHEVETGFGEAQPLAEEIAADFSEPLLREANEVFLFHGTSADKAAKITTGDFKINLAGSNAGTLYGRGVYFAENASKSDEYTWPAADGNRTMLVCRVLLGRAHYVDTKETDARACEEACLRGRCHSVVGDRKKCRGTFREFIIFDEEQAYPNYILTYRQVQAPPEVKSGSEAGQRQIQVTCPTGAAPGSVLQVTAPTGETIQVVLPPGIVAGQVFTALY
eukprot:TRINITY_DN11355_c0_g2_i1.p1 TRINITY_DN11355_c0_g2~~TRINITY_DN11355_c0_g2_i1.p1  ORF type:complete len:528 (-),score=126.58 TRINITY_DN11355_c0_g2_i1:147-1673(-)